MPGIFFLRERHFPVGFRGVALLLGDQIFFRQSIVTLEIESGPRFVGRGAVQVGFRSSDIFLPVTILFEFVIGLGLHRSGAGFGNFFRTIAAFRFLCVGA